MGREIRSCGKYQDYLPSLPVPQLKDTCRKYVFIFRSIIKRIINYYFSVSLLIRRYLDSVRPLLTKEEYTQTEQVSVQ